MATLFERMARLSRSLADPDPEPPKKCAICQRIFPDSIDGVQIYWYELAGISVCSRECRAAQWPDHQREATHGHA